MIRVLAWCDRNWQWGAMILAAMLCILALAACVSLPRPPAPPISAPQPIHAPAPPPVESSDPLAALRAERDEMRAQLAALDSRLRAAETEATLAPLRTMTVWAAWIGGAVALLSVVALVLLRVGVGVPVGARMIAGIGASGLALAVAAVGFGQALPWLGPVGLAALVLAIIGGIGWAAMTWRRAGRCAAREWKAYAAELPRNVREMLDAESRQMQGAIRSKVDELLRIE